MGIEFNISREVLKIDPVTATAEIESGIREIVFQKLRKRGVVLGISGGVDSSTTAALCARALGSNRVLGLFMPEMECPPDCLRLGRLAAAAFGIDTRVEDISGVLEAAGCYGRRDDAIREVVPEYGPGYKCKIVLSDVVSGAAYPLFTLVVETPDHTILRQRLTAHAYLGILAAMNFKQRTRKMMEYYYADLMNYAVVGTPNLLEYDQGFFVKNGDGSADLKPIAHLYKSQIYQIAEYIGVPEEIRQRPPSTDTYSLEQSQEEFFFSLPYDKMDLCLWAREHDLEPSALVADGLTEEQVKRAYRMIDAKRAATHYLHLPPLRLVDIRQDVATSSRQMEVSNRSATNDFTEPP